ncbi:hypothetical protein QBZ16_003568 [Prototheca wickerhamii]|uniref:SOUL heme-binding protein n=1 Tax=Prototheca wickerhamii TaxID=3111 RepID=A0AAD9II55_PROWI|nr:hypothetical protein QBZ16_003568 [Prototheca wickerhamii]
MATPRLFASLAGAPDFCGDMDCPPYKLIHETDNYEIRSYGSEKWVITNVTGSYYTVAYTEGTMRLLKYFKGASDSGEKLNLTTPTVVAFHLTEDQKGTEKQYTFGYYLPHHIAKDPPKPTNPDVEITTYPKTTRFVKVFGGFATDGNIVSQTKGLMDQLDKDGEKYESSMGLAAIYDAPQKLLNRHNEIHLFGHCDSYIDWE